MIILLLGEMADVRAILEGRSDGHTVRAIVRQHYHGGLKASTVPALDHSIFCLLYMVAASYFP